jgi:uncharacterized membrane protein YkoI
MNRWAKKIHVIATGIVGVQLVAWTMTGLAFTLFDFQVVRGVSDRAAKPSLDLASVRLDQQEAAAVARSARPGVDRVASMRLDTLDGRAVYEVTFADGRGEVIVDAVDGRTISIDTAVATRIATSAFRGPVRVRSVDRRDEDDRSTFVVHLDDARATDVVVDAATGEVTSWRNHTWRLFDTLWSVHVLGYIDRRSPAQWPLRIVALVAAIAVVSGATLLATRISRHRTLEKRTNHGLS